MIPLLAAAVRSGAPPVPDETRRQIAEADRQVQETALYIERSANRAIQTLIAAGLTPIVVKGVANAHLDYPESSLRQTGDVDLLVRASRSRHRRRHADRRRPRLAHAYLDLDELRPAVRSGTARLVLGWPRSEGWDLLHVRLTDSPPRGALGRAALRHVEVAANGS